MDTNCTCGCPIPRGASFCYNCGRPLRPIGVALDPSAVPADPVDSMVEVKTIQVGGQESIRASILPALSASVLMMIPMAGFFFFMIYPAAGYMTVVSLLKKHDSPVSLRKGCGLGGVTGIFSFIVQLVFIAVAMLTAGSNSLMESVRKQEGNLIPAEIIDQLMNDPTMFMMMLVAALLVQGVVMIGLSALGGAAAIKFNRSS